MTFTESVKRCMTEKYASMSGRAPRSEMWWFMLYFYAGLLFLGFLAFAVGNGRNSFLTGLFVIWLLVHLVPLFCVEVRRLHDTNRHWSNILIVFIPIIGAIGGIFLLVYWLTESDKFANKYGPEYPYNDIKPRLTSYNFSQTKHLLNQAWQEKYGEPYPYYTLQYIPQEHADILNDWYIRHSAMPEPTMGHQTSGHQASEPQNLGFCPFCGAAVRNTNVKFCWKCGKYLIEDD